MFTLVTCAYKYYKLNQELNNNSYYLPRKVNTDGLGKAVILDVVIGLIFAVAAANFFMAGSVSTELKWTFSVLSSFELSGLGIAFSWTNHAYNKLEKEREKMPK